MTSLDKLYDMNKDLSIIGLTLTKDFPPYFCTPLNADVFAYIGSDGIHFCIAKSEKGIENSPVYVVSPSMCGHYVELVGRNITDFLCLVITCKDASAIEYISYASEEKFIEHIIKINEQILDNSFINSAVEDAISTLKTVFKLYTIDNVFKHVKDTKENPIYHVNLTFSKEYYDLIDER